MAKRIFHQASILIIALALASGSLQAQTPVSRGASSEGENQFSNLLAQAHRPKRPAFSLMPSFSFTPMAGPSLTVMGSGTLGRLTKWAGFTSSNSFIGDSTIFESKAG